MKKDIREYTREEFLEMENFGTDAVFDAIIIVPTGDLHDSGWGNMKFVLTKDREIVGVVSGWSDVVHLNGIGGYGRNWRETMRTGMVPAVGWTIDCLPCGCLRLFCNRKCRTSDVLVLSDFEFFTEE